MKKKIILVIVLALILSSALLIFTSCKNNDVDDDVHKQTPVYQGMTITAVHNSTTLPSYNAGGKDDFDYDKDNGNHNGHFKGDHTGKDEKIDEETPYPENSENENIEEEIKSSLNVIGSPNAIYYANPNEDIYINIHINNPDNFEIMSFTLNDKKYSSYMFEDGSDMETIVLKYNVGDVAGIIEYTIDAIKYIDGTDIKDVLIDGNKTVMAGVKTENQVTANVTNVDIDTNAISFNVNVKDNNALVAFSKGALKAVLYDGFDIVSEKELAVGENAVTFDTLKTNTLYQYAIVGCYDDLSGGGFKAKILYKDAFYTDSVVLFDNIAIGQDKISFGFLWHEEYVGKAISALKLYQGTTLVASPATSTTEITNLLSNNTYKLIAEYPNGEKTESIYIEFTTKAKATPIIEITNTEKTKESLNFSVSVTDTDLVGAITKIELLHTSEDARVLTNALTQSISGLLSDNTYTLRVTYTCNLNDGAGSIELVKTLDAKTDEKIAPSFDITTPIKTKDSISFGITETDPDSVGEVSKTELIHNGITTVAASGTARSFEGLLSDNTYTLKVTYTYNLNNGEGSKILTDTVELKTDAQSAPSITFDNVVANASSVLFGVNEIDTDNIGEIIKLEILLGNDVVNVATDGGIRKFEGLLSNTDYTLRLTYKYNLRDGSDDVTVIKTVNAKTDKNNVPCIMISGGTQTQTSIGFTIEESDSSNIGSITKIELYRDGILVKSAPNTDVREFSKLLSNTEYTVKVTYTYNLNDGSGNKTEVSEITIKTFSMAKPSIIFEGTKKTKTSVGFDFNIVDVNDIGRIERIELIKDGDVVSYTTDPNATEFTNVLSDTAYIVKVIYAYDLNDGNGVAYIEKSAEIKTYAKESPEITVTNTNRTQTSLEFSVDVTDTDLVGAITKVELIHKNGVTNLNNVKAHTIDNLLSNNDYTLKVTYTYDLNDGEGAKAIVKELTVKTIAKATPEILVHTPTKTQTSVGFTMTETDTDNVGAITKIELVHANGTVVATSLEQRAFENLLSNNAYTVKVTYVYNLNDGTGDITVIKELSINTNAKEAPSFTVKNENITTDSINAEYDVTDTDNILSSYKLELYEDDLLISANSENKIEFTTLSYYTDYTVRFTYTYNLNDGNGQQTTSYDYSFKTLPYIDVTECSIANTSAVSEGDTIFMSVKLDNPLNMDIESVVINGETYNVTSASTKNKIFVEIVYNGQFAGGDTHLKIDKVNAVIDSTTHIIEPKTELSDDVFINGAVEVLKIELVNSEFEPFEENDWIFPSEKIYVLITLNNQTGYVIDSFSDYTKLDDNRYYYEMPSWSGWSAGNSISSLTYHNEYISKTVSLDTVSLKNNVFCVVSNEIKYISTPDDLKNMSGGYYYELAKDIDLNGIEWQGGSFYGVFDGKGYSIKNMSFVSTVSNYDAYLGLFAKGYGYITNINITEATVIASITSDSNSYKAHCGGLIAEVIGKTHISNCTVDEYSVFTVNNTTPMSYTYVGGMIGCASVSRISITNCTNNGNIRAISTYGSEGGRTYAAGLAAYIESTPESIPDTIVITSCTNNGKVSADSLDANAGGLICYIGVGSSTVTIASSTNSGDVSVSSVYGLSGGLAAYVCLDITITNCTNSGEISISGNGSNVAGGLIGEIYDSTVTIESCTNSGSISGSTCGGLVGNACDAFITNSTNNGSVNASCGNSAVSGGLIALVQKTATITSCVNNGDVSATSAYYSYLGGLIGRANYEFSSVTISRSVNNGTINAVGAQGVRAGGFIADISYILTISDSVNNGTVTSDTQGDSRCGGFVGASQGSVTVNNSINNALVSATGSYAEAGGLVGCTSMYTMITNSVNNGEVNGLLADGGLIGTVYNTTPDVQNSYSRFSGSSDYNGSTCTVEQLNSKEFYTETLGWSEDIWDFSELDVENGKYPTLKNA